MKILLISDGIYPFSMGGSHRSIYELANELHKRNHEITCLVPVIRENQNMYIKNTEWRNKKGFKIIRFNVPKNFFLRLISYFYLFKKEFLNLKEHFDIINIHYLPALNRFNKYFKRQENIVYSFHGPWSEEFLEVINGKFKKISFPLDLIFLSILSPLILALLTFIEKKLLRNSRTFVINSNYMKKKLLEKTSADSIKIFKIHHGVNLKKFYPSKKDFNYKNKKTYNLITIRRLESRMGIDLLIKSISLLKRKTSENFHLFIGGQGSEKHYLEMLIKKLECQKEVTIMGFIPENDMRKHLSSADLFILPSRSLEGFGLVLLESMMRLKSLVHLDQITFNCGYGMVVILEKSKLNKFENLMKKHKLGYNKIGVLLNSKKSKKRIKFIGKLNFND